MSRLQLPGLVPEYFLTISDITSLIHLLYPRQLRSWGCQDSPGSLIHCILPILQELLILCIHKN